MMFILCILIVVCVIIFVLVSKFKKIKEKTGGLTNNDVSIKEDVNKISSSSALNMSEVNLEQVDMNINFDGLNNSNNGNISFNNEISNDIKPIDNVNDFSNEVPLMNVKPIMPNQNTNEDNNLNNTNVVNSSDNILGISPIMDNNVNNNSSSNNNTSLDNNNVNNSLFDSNNNDNVNGIPSIDLKPIVVDDNKK